MQFLGRYELLGEIASGGMGKVYLGRVVGEGGFEREVALKVMHEHLLGDPDFVAMFLDEARLAARIRHPNVVPTLDVQKTDDALFLVMDFVEGLSLSALLRQLKHRDGLAPSSDGATGESEPTTEQRKLVGVPLPIDIAMRLLLDTLHGLHAAHELKDRDGQLLNLVHRDVSPANILVGTDGIARITDFGVARAEARLSSTRGGQIKGKLPYMPPEQIVADAVDRRADVYSAGVVLWEMLVGRRLFQADHQGALLKKVLAGADTPPSSADPAVPTAVDEVCMRALAIDPDQRFATTADFADELEVAVRSSGLSVASAKRVAAFASEFETNVSRMEDARKSIPSSFLRGLPPGVREVPSVPSAVADGSGVVAARRSGVVAAPGAEAGTEITLTSGENSHTRTAAVVSTTAGPAPGRSRRLGLVIGGLVGLVVGGALAVITLSSGPSHGEESSAASAPTATSATDDSEPAVTTMAEPTASPTDAPAQSSTAEPTETPDAGATAKQRSTPRRPSGMKTRPRKQRPKPGAGKSDALPSDFLPPEL